jgi:nicotinate-nucleotide--dimethylbenzimidazole phosphoribosyltransferase
MALADAAADDGVDALIPGEMGIGNTASAALILHRLAPAPLGACIGLGAGHDAAGLERKIAVLARAAQRSPALAPLEVLAEFGGLEIAMMAGLILAAIRLSPAAQAYCVFAHGSAERGHAILLQALGVEPLLDLGLRLGEGTGAVLAAPIVRAAARMLTTTASLDDVLSGRL